MNTEIFFADSFWMSNITGLKHNNILNTIIYNKKDFLSFGPLYIKRKKIKYRKRKKCVPDHVILNEKQFIYFIIFCKTTNKTAKLKTLVVDKMFEFGG